MKNSGERKTPSSLPQADRRRLVEEFAELVSFDSESLSERQIALRIKAKLEEAGCTVEEDDTASITGGSCGNIFARLKGQGEPLLLSAHMDTVSPGKGKEAIFREDGRIEGNGKAVLGADDVTGIVEILEGIRILEENHIMHRPLEILFTVSEESFGRGAHAFDTSRIKAKSAYVMDLSGPVGLAALQAPTLIMFRIKIEGRAAHAGFEPERGINAIEVASRAIAKIPQGRIDEGTTFNIGRIEGGRATNIVADSCSITGEVRSYDHAGAERIVDETEAVFRREAQRLGGRIHTGRKVLIRAYKVDEESEVCGNFLKALKMIGEEPGCVTDDDGSRCGPFISTFGGSDNNILKMRGIDGIVLSTGMYNVHSTEEYATMNDLEKGSRLVAALCTL